VKGAEIRKLKHGSKRDNLQKKKCQEGSRAHSRLGCKASFWISCLIIESKEGGSGEGIEKYAVRAVETSRQHWTEKLKGGQKALHTLARSEGSILLVNRRRAMRGELI